MISSNDFSVNKLYVAVFSPFFGDMRTTELGMPETDTANSVCRVLFLLVQ